MTTKPNRSRQQQTGSEEARRKASGDQHTDLLNEDSEPLTRPHRTNRIDEAKSATGYSRADDTPA